MEKSIKKFLSITTLALFMLLPSCSGQEALMKVPGHYLLNGTLNENSDANGFAYYTNGNEAYVAYGSCTSLTPEVPASVSLGGTTYQVTGVYHGGFAKTAITSITLPL